MDEHHAPFIFPFQVDLPTILRDCREMLIIS